MKKKSCVQKYKKYYFSKSGGPNSPPDPPPNDIPAKKNPNTKYFEKVYKCKILIAKIHQQKRHRLTNRVLSVFYLID